jgi:membrane-associated phospholipid phosphatase
MGTTVRSECLLALLLFISFPTLANAAETAAEAAAPQFEQKDGVADGIVGAVGTAAVHLATDLHEQISYPFALAGRSPAKFLIGATGIVALILSDQITYRPMAEPTFLPPGKLVGPAHTLSNIGNTQNAIPLVLGIGAIGLVTGSQREKQTSVMLAEAMFTSGLWTSALKYVAGRERPRELHEESADWTGPGGMLGDDGEGGSHASFPSGHATGIWAVATVLAHQYPTYHVVPTLAYGSAVAISYSRMVVKAHFLSDVVVGGLIGYGCARQVIGAHERDSDPSRLHLLYEPSGGEQRVGVAIDF